MSEPGSNIYRRETNAMAGDILEHCHVMKGGNKAPERSETQILSALVCAVAQATCTVPSAERAFCEAILTLKQCDADALRRFQETLRIALEETAGDI